MARYKILIVDDEENVVSSLSRVLRNEKHDIVAAKSAEDALLIVEAEIVDLIICDYKLIGMDGISFLEKVLETNPEIITILLTGNADLQVAVDAVNKTSVYKFILKPWDNEMLRISIMRALEHRDLIVRNKLLINEIKKRNSLIELLERDNPGITRIKKDSSGNIILD